MWVFFFKKHCKQLIFLCVYSLNDSDQMQGIHPARSCYENVKRRSPDINQTVTEIGWVFKPPDKLRVRWTSDPNSRNDSRSLFLCETWFSAMPSSFKDLLVSDKCHLQQ